MIDASRGPAHLAIDLGAGSGRAFLGELRGGILCIGEIHRFSNEPVAAREIVALRRDPALGRSSTRAFAR